MQLEYVETVKTDRIDREDFVKEANIALAEEERGGQFVYFVRDDLRLMVFRRHSKLLS